MKLLRLLFLFLFFPLVVNASPGAWEIVPSESQITFTGTQNGAPVKGSFKHFTGEIVGDINDLKASQVKIDIDTNSLSTSYKELEDGLKAEEWFDIKLFPKATFEAKSFAKIAENNYQADGTLTIKNVTIPLRVTFKLTDYTPTKATVEGSTTIKRNAFGIGRGEWASTDEVKDEVQIDFKITANKA